MIRLYQWWRSVFPKNTDTDPEFTRMMREASQFGEEQRLASISAQNRITQNRNWRNSSIQERFGASSGSSRGKP